MTAKLSAGMAESSPAASRGGNARIGKVAILALCVVGATIGYNSVVTNHPWHNSNAIYEEQQRQLASDAVAATPAKNRKLSGMERLLETEPEPEEGDSTKEDILVEKIAQKLQPTSLVFFSEAEMEERSKEGGLEAGDITVAKKNKFFANRGDHQKRTMVPHQFLHLHHMKTGGTSIDRLLRCSTTRLKNEANYDVPYFSIHECSRERFKKCLNEPDNMCRPRMQKASVMSYCAPLKHLEEFNWWHDNNDENAAKAFTVLRHPVDRVWSMFRFQTKNCYKCTPLKDIYNNIDKGIDTGLDPQCLAQLQNHEVNNLLSTEWDIDVVDIDPENNADIATEMVQQAVDNMKGFFTVVGITEELPATAEILGKAFPWMSLDGEQEEHGTTSQCELPHANASPSNNRCGEGNTHWDLPDHPDEETRALIAKHNAMDMELYEAAVSYFELQKKALDLVEK
jgi:hypothetical protein